MATSDAYTAKAFAEKMDAFIGFCESEGMDATDYQLIKYFEISPTCLEEYRTHDKLNDDSIEKYEGFAAALKKLDLYREDATIRQVVSDPKLTSHGAFKLRQPHWGGWGDKPDAASDVSIRMKIGDGDSTLLD